LLIDAHAWIEYLLGSQKGEKLNEILLNEENEIKVISITISEVLSKTKRMGMNIETAYNSIINNSEIIETNAQSAKEAGLLHAKMKNEGSSIGIVDCLLIKTAIQTNSKLVTGDLHFKNFKEAIIL
jgi:predicted nucleic acid-binding protein